MPRVVAQADDVDELVGVEELRQAAGALLDDDFEMDPALDSPGDLPQQRLGSGFAHIGTITEHGRRSYAKLAAVFSNASYPGSNCGISILGA